MSAIRLTCPCGHTWEHTQAVTVPTDLRLICPVCSPGATDGALPKPGTVLQSAEQSAASAAESATGAPGVFVTGFEILEELDRGGMGVVYKARQTGLNRIVAVKMISPRSLLVPGARELFEHEVRAAARLNHPNIVTAFHTELGGPRPYLAMEFVSGIDLRRLVEQSGPLSVADAVYYIREAADGLQHAHEQGLVHRDVKPSNLMVAPAPGAGEAKPGKPPRVKILDLGLARMMNPTGRDAERPAEPGAFLGTPDFVAPEQAADPDRADARSDLFSLGGTLYFLLTGTAPFPGETIAEKLHAMSAGPPSPVARSADVPPTLDAVVRKLLALDPADRYQTAGEVVVALDGLAHARLSPTDGRHLPTRIVGAAPAEADLTTSPGLTAGFRTHGALMSDNLFDRQRAALAQLSDGARDRATAEAELTAAFQATAEKAEREVTRARKAHAAAHAQEVGALDAEHAADEERRAKAFTAEQLANDRTREDRRKQTTERFNAAQKRGETEYKDKQWSHDSVLEGGEKAAKDQLESLQRKAAAGSEQVDAKRAELDPLLKRGRVKPEEVEPTGELPPPTDDDPIKRMNKWLETASGAIKWLGYAKSPGWGSPARLLVLVALFGAIGASAFAFVPDAATAGAIAGAVGLVFGLGLWVFLRWYGHRVTVREGKVIAQHLTEAARSVKLLQEYAASEYEAEVTRLRERHARKRRETDEYFKPLLETQKKQFEAEMLRVESEFATTAEQLRRKRGTETRAADERYRTRKAEIEGRLGAELNIAEAAYAEKVAAVTAARDDAWQTMAAAWNGTTAAVAATFTELRAESDAVFPPWEQFAPQRLLADRVPAGIRFGDLSVNLGAITDAVPTDERLAVPPALAGAVPAFLPFPDKCSVLLRCRDEGRAAGVSALQAMMLRFLTGLPPGKVRFTIVDPVGLGDNFAAFMHLADFDEKLVTAQIWTEGRDIEQRLIDLTDHTASVIQKYLRNQYKSIEEYNRAAGEVAEPYRVLVVANFPANFSPEAAKRLVSLAQSGPSCGVCVLVTADTKAAMPRDFNIADLEAVSYTAAWKEGKFVPKDPVLAPFPPVMDRPPEPATVAAIVQRVGKASKDAVRVEVPFEYIAPKPDDVWHASAAKGFEVPVGRAGATRKQVFSLGRGTAQHAVIAGKTGSGKSTLLHALITNLALTYSPDEAELYLIDFKEGVEFQWYATYRLPHARVVAIQSEREFGLSVLQRLDGILRERGEKFRDTGVNDLAGYRAAKPNEKTPRILLVIDEFQAFFTEDDKLAQEAALLLDRLVRQGRAFGLHVLLGSQTLGGAYSLARSTIDQMAVRVALQCSDADAQLILSKDNTAARLLSRPGEAIYNDQNGLTEGNDPFQVVWLAEEKREQVLEELHQRAGDRWPAPLVFSGNTSADLANNRALAKQLAAPSTVKAPAAWLGDPVAIKEPTAAVFRQQGGANLLLIGQTEDATRALFVASTLSLAAQIPGAQFTMLDGTPDDAGEAEYLRKFAEKLPGATAPPRTGAAAALAELTAEIERRQKGEAERTPRFLFIFGIHRFRELRKAEDDFSFGRKGEREPSPAERLATILRDGPLAGVHVVTWCDSLVNLNRAFDRPLLREFALRVLFQMSATDSSTLMDAPTASKLGRHRALFLQEEQERPEKFRPYGLPPVEWLNEALDALRSRVGLNAEPASV
jgi:DNA segregation ATPase FtsK/SpoIIIE, S-DNA-T family